MNIILKKFQDKTKENCVYIVYSGVNRLYLTGADITDGILIITKTKAYGLYDARCIETAENLTCGFELVLYKGISDYIKIINNLIDNGVNELSFEYSHISVADLNRLSNGFGKCSITDSSEIFSSIRMAKEDFEIEKIKKAQSITDKTFSDILYYIKENFKKGITEKDIERQIDIEMLRLGADTKAFDTICVSGENTSMPHGIAGGRKVIDGGFITMDFGAKLGGYCSDMTRTICIGNVSGEMNNVYETVLRAQEAVLDSISSAMSGYEADLIARNIIDENYSGRFTHALGHGLGIEIHESGGLTPGNKELLASGSVVSVEPGVYLSGKFGVRIEDIVCITVGGCINFTKSQKELIIIK